MTTMIKKELKSLDNNKEGALVPSLIRKKVNTWQDVVRECGIITPKKN